MYCDKHGRPYVDVRIVRIHILDDPYDDPPDMPEVLKKRSISLIQSSDLPEKYQVCSRWLSSTSPDHKRHPDEVVETRISATEAFGEEDEEAEKRNQIKRAQKEDKSRAVVLEMLGDLPSAGKCHFVLIDNSQYFTADISTRYKASGECLVRVQIKFCNS